MDYDPNSAGSLIEIWIFPPPSMRRIQMILFIKIRNISKFKILMHEPVILNFELHFFLILHKKEKERDPGMEDIKIFVKQEDQLRGESRISAGGGGGKNFRNKNIIVF